MSKQENLAKVRECFEEGIDVNVKTDDYFALSHAVDLNKYHK